MITLAAPQTITLSIGQSFTTPPVVVDALTNTIAVLLRRPTTAVPLPWGMTDTLRVSLVLTTDGVEHRYAGRVSGGVRLDTNGQELGIYQLVARPTVMFGDRARTYLETATRDGEGFYRNVPLTRMGELATTVTAHVELECISGNVTTDLLSAATTEAPAPLLVRHKNSVEWDADTSAKEVAGDGVISVAHAPSGSSNLGVFFGAMDRSGAPGTNTATIDGSGAGVTELWDLIQVSVWTSAGYTKAAIGTGSKTYQVTNTNGSPTVQFIGVITFTGVDQTTPTGTAATASGFTNPATVTVTGVGTDDMVVDQHGLFDTATPTAPGIGADQTERNAEIDGTDTWFKQSTQPGTAGGVMSWSNDAGNVNWGIGAVAMKPAAGGGPAQDAPEKLRIVSAGSRWV